MNVLLTGSFGNIGTKVIDALLARGHEVRCFDLAGKHTHETARAYESRVEMCWGDITHRDEVIKAVSGMDAVIHNAAMIPPMSEEKPQLAKRINVDGTAHVIEGIQACPKPPHLIFPSSVSVHGYHLPEHPYPRRIDDPLNAEDEYAGHKIRCEEMIEAAGIDWTILRIGACMDADSRMGGSMEGALKMTFNVSPRCRVEYVHPRDVATAMCNALGNPEAIGGRFFLGGGESCRAHWREFCSVGLEAMGLGLLPEEAFGSGGYYTDWMDTEEAQRVLNFQNHTLEDYRQAMFHQRRWMRRLTLPLRPLIRKKVLSYSPYLD